MTSQPVTASPEITEPTVMRLNVTATKAITSGKSKAGHRWTLCLIDCVTIDGEPLDRNCLSFYACRKGIHEFEVTPQEREGHEPSYLLKPTEPEDAGDILERLEALEETVRNLARRVYEGKADE